MRQLIYSGLLYLLGVAILLAWKPELMFTKDGNWKEFGLGRNSDRYTWMPFWLFVILWAMLSYAIVLVLSGEESVASVASVASADLDAFSLTPKNVSTKPLRAARTAPQEMKPGYYILDANETAKRGIPKYIFLGPETPQLIFHNQSMAPELSAESD